MSNDEPLEFPGNDSTAITRLQSSELSKTLDNLISQKTQSYGVNPLVSAADGLLSLPAILLSEPSYQNINGLREIVLTKMKDYDNDARIANFHPDDRINASKIICAFIDEAVLNTSMGSNSLWANKRLLSTLHNEANGGEIFFTILDESFNEFDSNLDLFELIFICISLGFKGRYAVIEEGAEHLEALKNQIFDQIQKHRGNFSKDLSPDWQSVIYKRNTLHDYIPLWVVVAVASALLLSIFLGFTLALDSTLEPVYESLINITQNDSIKT